MSIGSILDDGLGDGSTVFTPKIGTSLIFQEASSQDALCVDGSTAERSCLVSSVKSAAVFKVVATAAVAKDGGAGADHLLSLRCTSLGRGSDDSDGFLYFSDLNQKVHCTSQDATPLWQLVEPVDDVVAGKRAKEATYVLRVVAQWWFPAVVLRRCHAPSDNTYLSEDGHERHHSMMTSLAQQAFESAGRGGAKYDGNSGNPAGSGGRGEPAANVDESPATAAFARLQNNIDNGFSASFEDNFAAGRGGVGGGSGGSGGGGSGGGGGGGGGGGHGGGAAADDALAFVPVPGEEAFYAVRFRSGVVEAVPLSAMCTAEQMRVRSQRRQASAHRGDSAAAAAAAAAEAGNINGSSQYQTTFSPREEVFVGPPFFDGLGQYVCRAETLETPSNNRRSKSVSVDGRDNFGRGGGGYASDDDFGGGGGGSSSSVDDNEFVVSDKLSTPLLRSTGKKPPRRERRLTLRPEMDKALRWNRMMS